ncbi:hypothetical protein TVAG_010610 [Trichomonas vaginalis G3]|uniref:Uncharacterized protein n=1 Tax=Trichomonas vaginalis (strain ATCC PRA-98 / G3) TaxID=412133 RepID=A2DNY8_TRIV3|nr:hypothetical protein TVAGG3_0989980 [Trichomonas vaginalis G3]EAY17837.1 hypothetical protein TVAG_010610 [Trichomonas vaginalis G3]KAI5489962.1 hypothetical protein TVAGG3_0989980 [Trichomonas vaginalis G3]|eukprot:XP_001329972.1 hypothetical protein [Trichomonas vaginalis G3]
MSATLTDKEKNDITTILDQVESSVQDPNKQYHSLLKIDEECREIWPSWNGSFYTPNHKSVSFVKGTTATKLPSYTEISEQVHEENKTQNNFRNNDQIQVEVTTQNPEAQQLVNEVDSIKDDLTDLMQKLSQTVHSPDQVPQLVGADPLTACDMNEISSVDFNHSRDDNLYGQLTKQQQLAIVIQVQREIMAQKEANSALEKEIQDLKVKYVKSQKRIVFLRNEIKKSTIVLQELKRRDEENKPNDNQLVDTSQMY